MGLDHKAHQFFPTDACMTPGQRSCFHIRYSLIVQAALRRRYEYHVPCFNETDYDTATCMQFDTSFVPAKKKPLLRVVGKCSA